MVKQTKPETHKSIVEIYQLWQAGEMDDEEYNARIKALFEKERSNGTRQ